MPRSGRVTSSSTRAHAQHVTAPKDSSPAHEAGAPRQVGCRNLGAQRKGNMNKQLPTPKAFRRSPSLEISTWYKGILTTQLAGEADTGGAFAIG
jgi:hypothetical protein